MTKSKHTCGVSSAWGLPVVLLFGAISQAPAANVNRYGALPLAFEPNQGQSVSDSKYLVRRGNSTMFFRDHEAVLAVSDTQSTNPKNVEAIRFIWVNSLKSTISGEAKAGGVTNYLIGRDKSQWKTNIPQFSRVRYRNLYPGVDLVYYGKDGALEYDLVVAPGADTSAIRLQVLGGKNLDLRDGDLIVHTAHGDLVHKAPVVFQEVAGVRKTIESRYRFNGKGEIEFELGQYDRRHELVIDPTITYGRLFGGTGSDNAESIAVDSTGATYVAGTTASSDISMSGSPTGFTFKGSNDAFVLKLNPAGNAIVYSTYIGGTSSDQAHAVAVDTAGSAYVAGTTSSSDYPTYAPLRTGLQGSSDAFLTKLSASGSSVVYSTYIGGSSTEVAWGVAVDASQNAYVVGTTASLTIHDNPVLVNRSGNSDAFLAKVTGTPGFAYVRFVGGSGLEVAYAVTLKDNFVYLTGTTTSTNLSSTALQAANGGGTDAFIQKAGIADGAPVLWAYYGGAADETPRGIALDNLGNLYIGGWTNGTGLTTKNPLQSAFKGSNDGFLMGTDLNLSALNVATYLGGAGDDKILGIAANPNNSLYVTGSTNSSDFPIKNNIMSSPGVSTDAFVVKYSYLLGSYLFSTYLGGSGTDVANAVAADNTGVYIAGSTLSPDFQGISGTLRAQDAFMMKLTSGCSYTFNPNPVAFTAAGGQVTVSVTAGPECGWTATTSDSFLTIGSPAYGAGNGSFTVTASNNSGAPARTGNILVGGVTLPVTQASACTYALQGNASASVPADSVSTGSVTIVPSLPSCTWTASSDSAWASITAGASGTGTGSVSYRTALNPLPSQRVAVLNIGGQSFTITQVARVRNSQSVATFNNGAWRIDAARAFVQNSSNLIFAWGTTGWTAVAGDWTGDGVTKVGVYKDGVWILDVNNSRRLDAGDRIFQWGNAGMAPVVGDWNGDGTTKVGVYQNGNWYIDINGNRTLDNGEAFAWGPSNGTPMTGDWNGDGKTKVGAYNPSTGTWILDTNGDYAYQFPNDFFFQWGAPGFTPLVGDFFGLGKDTVAAYQSGRFWLENGDGFSNAGDVTFTFISNSTGTPFLGDWNGDGKTKVGIQTGNQLTFDYDGDRTLNLTNDKQITYGIVGDTVVVGRWN